MINFTGRVIACMYGSVKAFSIVLLPSDQPCCEVFTLSLKGLEDPSALDKSRTQFIAHINGALIYEHPRLLSEIGFFAVTVLIIIS
jgi:hypothetical protein